MFCSAISSYLAVAYSRGICGFSLSGDMPELMTPISMSSGISYKWIADECTILELITGELIRQMECPGRWMDYSWMDYRWIDYIWMGDWWIPSRLRMNGKLQEETKHLPVHAIWLSQATTSTFAAYLDILISAL